MIISTVSYFFHILQPRHQAFKPTTMKAVFIISLFALPLLTFSQSDPSTVEANKGYFIDANVDQLTAGFIDANEIHLDNKNLDDHVLFASANWSGFSFQTRINFDPAQTIITSTGVRFDFVNVLNPATAHPVCTATASNMFAVAKVSASNNHVTVDFVNLSGSMVRPDFSVSCYR